MGAARTVKVAGKSGGVNVCPWLGGAKVLFARVPRHLFHLRLTSMGECPQQHKASNDCERGSPHGVRASGREVS